ncbi:MAG TPA: hypothetical protein VMV92_18675 [Streptosporangiaceae bacterium]|nr:hypothetical protein [Streptosporangiaceae bacterium]
MPADMKALAGDAAAESAALRDLVARLDEPGWQQPTPADGWSIPVRVELAAPGGGTWTWGAEDSADRVAGPALDFCLVVTQRRHLGDTSLVVSGPGAVAWMAIAQAFAGPPGVGRRPGQFG